MSGHLTKVRDHLLILYNLLFAIGSQLWLGERIKRFYFGIYKVSFSHVV